MNPAKMTLLGCATIAAPLLACYPATAYNCSYYYGYYDPYCGYYYYDTYSTAETYSEVSYSQVDVDETPHPDPNVAPKAPDSIVAVQSYTYLARDPEAPGDDKPDLSKIDDKYPCNEAKDDALALCSANDQKFVQSGDDLLVAFQLEQPLAHNDMTNFFVVAFSFDADGDPANNFTPPAETANDYFGGTDKWYAASYTPADGWTLGAFAWNGTTAEPVPTTARIILERDSVALLAPSSEFAVPIPGNRISLFRHTGDMGANGDWSGLVYPPLGAPLNGP